MMKKFFVLSVVAIFFGFSLVSCGGSDNKAKTETKQEAPKEVKKEVKKETKKEVSAADFTANLENGKAVYQKACIACHMTGVAGAAKLTDKERWTESANKGLNTLFNHALHGFQGKHGVMPEKGTCAACSEQDIFDALNYILKEAGVTAK